MQPSPPKQEKKPQTIKGDGRGTQEKTLAKEKSDNDVKRDSDKAKDTDEKKKEEAKKDTNTPKNKDQGRDKDNEKEKEKDKEKDKGKDQEKDKDKEKEKDKDKDKENKSPEEGKKEKGGAFAALKAKLNDAKDAVKDHAVNLANKVKDGLDDSDDSEDSSADDEDDDDDWLMDDASAGATTTASTRTAPSATAITFRNKPAPEFLNLEEEKQIRAQVKSAKQIKKKTKKLKKFMKKTVKCCQQSGGIYDSFITYTSSITKDNLCIDNEIAKSLQGAVDDIHNFRDGPTFMTFNDNITAIGEQLKAVQDHAKLLAVTEKARRDARDKRIKMEQSDLDVTDEAEYRKAMDTKTDYGEKDARYKEEFKSFLEHNSSQLGQTLRNTLLSNAKFLEDLAGALRQAANVEGNNCWFFSDEAVNKYADFKVDPELIKTPVQLFGDDDTTKKPTATTAATAVEDAYDRLTVKPPTQAPKGEVVQGIPVSEAGQAEANTYGTSDYSRLVKLPTVPASTTSTLNAPSVTITSAAPTNRASTARAASAGADGASSATDSAPTTGKRKVDYVKKMEQDYGFFLDNWGMGSGKDLTADSKKEDRRSPDTYFGSEAVRTNSVRSMTPTNECILPNLSSSRLRGDI